MRKKSPHNFPENSHFRMSLDVFGHLGYAQVLYKNYGTGDNKLTPLTKKSWHVHIKVTGQN